MSRPTTQRYKEMLVDALIKKHEGLAQLHANAPHAESIETLAETITSHLDYDTDVTLHSEYDGSYEVNVLNISLNRSGQKMVASACNEIADLRSSLQSQMDDVVLDFIEVARIDLEQASDPEWSWANEAEDSVLDSSIIWLQNASSLSSLAVKEYLELVFRELPPSHAYAQSLLKETSEYGGEMTNILTCFYDFKDCKRWVLPVVSAIVEENNPRVVKQMDNAFKGLWLKNATSYMLKGCETSKNNCSEIELLGFDTTNVPFSVTVFNTVDIENFGDVLTRASEYPIWREILFSDIETPAPNSFAFTGSNVYNALKKVSQAHADVFFQHHLTYTLKNEEREEVESRSKRKI